jgi:C4-dicarboxylate-specific signal transduction histidine kinase
VEWINDAVGKGAGLTSQLLTFARQQEPEVEDLDLNVLVRNTLGLLQRLLGARVKVVTSLEPARSPGSRGSPSQLRQVGS